MCARVSRANISPVMQTICNELESLKTKIDDDVSNVNDQEVARVLASLHKLINQLTREIKQSSSIEPFEGKSLLTLIHSIQHTPAYSQALGPQQAELMGLFKRIQSNIPEAQSKVQPVEMDIHKQR